MMHAKRVAQCTAALSLAVVLSAHVGSPDVYYSGKAGPYQVDVAIRPPKVVPGIAEVFVHVADPGVTKVVVRPVFWRAGSKGAPQGDDAKRVEGTPGGYSGQLWLMTSGSYSVDVHVAGPAGSGSVVVPVLAVATGQLGLSPLLKTILGVLGTLLFAGIITAIHAAVGESQLVPGEQLPPARRRRARVAAIIAVPVIAFLLFGGARWWNAEARRYTRTLYKPIPTRITVADSTGVPMLTQTITDTNWKKQNITAIMPDHGKMSHMFVVMADSPFVFAHLHPAMPQMSTLTTALPPLPAGRYRVFTDIVHESGFQRTLVDSFALAAGVSNAGATQLSADDAWFDGPSAKESSLGDKVTLTWAGPEKVTANQTGVLKFAMRDKTGGPVGVEPYLGTYGHAVVIRRDGGVFIHLHPSGTSSMASQLAFTLRNRGDTTGDGRLRLDSAPMKMDGPTPLSEISFPYAFPSAGRYRVWVQVRLSGKVRTAAVDVDVQAPQG